MPFFHYFLVSYPNFWYFRGNLWHDNIFEHKFNLNMDCSRTWRKYPEQVHYVNEIWISMAILLSVLLKNVLWFPFCAQYISGFPFSRQYFLLFSLPTSYSWFLFCSRYFLWLPVCWQYCSRLPLAEIPLPPSFEIGRLILRSWTWARVYLMTLKLSNISYILSQSA